MIDRELFAKAVGEAVAPLLEKLEAMDRRLAQLQASLPGRNPTVKEYAAELGVHVSTVQRGIAGGSIPVVRVGRRVRIDTSKLCGPSDHDIAVAARKARGL